VRILFIGDIFGRPGRDIAQRAIPLLVSSRDIDLVVANVENSAAGTTEDVTDKEDAHSVGPDGDTDLAASAILDPGKRDAELTGCHRRSRASRVDGAAEAHHARETPERPLRHVERGIRMPAAGRAFSAGDQGRPSSEDDLHGVQGHAREVHDDVDAGGGFKDVEGRVALSRAPSSLRLAVEHVEQATQFVAHLAAFKVDAGHGLILQVHARDFVKRAVSGTL